MHRGTGYLAMVGAGGVACSSCHAFRGGDKEMLKIEASPANGRGVSEGSPSNSLHSVTLCVVRASRYSSRKQTLHFFSAVLSLQLWFTPLAHSGSHMQPFIDTLVQVPGQSFELSISWAGPWSCGF